VPEADQLMETLIDAEEEIERRLSDSTETPHFKKD
jgi:hypothetical protein